MNNMTKLAEYESRKRSYGIAYLLWILFGWCGGHALYLRQPVIAFVWILLTFLTITDPVTFFKIYMAASLIEWVRVYLRTRELNEEALVWLKHSDENGNLNPQNNHSASV